MADTSTRPKSGLLSLPPDWQATGNLASMRDARRVWRCDGPVTMTGVLEAGEAVLGVRLVTTAERPEAVCRLTVGTVTLVLTAAFDGDIRLDADGTALTYDLRAYDTILPTWSEAVRRPIERDMAGLPLSQDKWLRLRVVSTNGRLRLWVDDRLLVDREASGGVLRLELPDGARVSEVTHSDVPPTSGGFEPLALDGYVRDRALLGKAAVADGALPDGQTMEIVGVPLRLVARGSGADHLDVSRSLVRQGQMEGYLPTTGPRYAGSLCVDPARLQLRVPNGRYDALYVLAGFVAGPHRIPTLSAAFFQPTAGYAQCFTTEVPSVTADSADAVPVPVTLDDGRTVNLWLVKIPLDPARLAAFAGQDVLEVELTKAIAQYRGYPDPITYGWHGAGLPSGVQVYAVTLHRPEVELSIEPTVYGHVWTAPDEPAYRMQVANQGSAKTVALIVRTISHDEQEVHEYHRTMAVPADGAAMETVSCPVAKNGLHRLEVTLRDGALTWTETRNFCRLREDTRTPYWQEGDGPLFGYWSYHGGHDTPPGEEIARIMHAAGARTSVKLNNLPDTPAGRKVKDYRWPTASSAWPVKPQWEWASEEPVDPDKYAAYQRFVIDEIIDKQGDNPDFVTFFPEPHLSRDLSGGVPRDYYGEAFTLTAEEQRALRVFWVTAQAAAEAVRARWPRAKILIPWGDPLFIVPFLRAGFPKELIDGSGLDMIGFERLPEQQICEQSNNRLYVLNEEFKRAGHENPQLYYVEGTFCPTEAGGLTWDEQAERYHRWTLLSLANGIERFYAGWFAFDCGDWYGSEHYGGCGIQRRLPYADPKPAYAHFATVTRLLERTRFTRYLPTGSHTAFCLEFDYIQGQTPTGMQGQMAEGQVKGLSPAKVYALWSVRGTRPITLSVSGPVTVIDSMDNGTEQAPVEGKVTLTLSASPVYVVGAEITAAMVGEPDHASAITWARERNQATWHDGPAQSLPEVGHVLTLGSFGDGTWRLTGEADALFEGHNYDDPRFPGNLHTTLATDPERPGRVLAVGLGEQERERQLASWYGVLAPRRPVRIPGKACALGVWVKAHSDWGRLVFLLRDAKGELWLSAGTRDQWNCNDTHGWLSFAFDGWRYLRMELPASSPWDGFRAHGATWWGSYGGDGLVDLPLTIEKVYVTRRTHVIHVNDILPADPRDVLLGEIVAEYGCAADAGPAAVKMNRVRMPLPRRAAGTANPIAKLARDGVLPPVELSGVTMPDWGYDGTCCHVNFNETPAAAHYRVWVAAYPDGAGAVAVANLTHSGTLVRNLRPAVPLYLWVSYTDAAGRESKPSNRLRIELVDAFGRK